MTDEKMYTLVCKAIQSPMDCVLDLIKAKEELEEDLRVAEDKRTRPANQVSILKRFMKEAMAYPRLGDGYSPYYEKYAFCDGYRLVVLNNNFGYRQCESPLNNIDDLLKEPCQNNIEVKVDTADVKQFILREKAEGRGTQKYAFKPYVIHTDTFDMGFNPQWLLDMINLIHTNSLWVSHPHKPAYLCNCLDEEGILLPIRLR